MPSQAVCLSICHTPVFCQNGFFHHRVATKPRHSSCFSIPNSMAIFRPGPLMGARRMQGVRKNAILDQYLALSWKRYEIKPSLMEGE